MLYTEKTIARRSAIIATLTIVATTGIIAARVAALDAKPVASLSPSAATREPNNRWLDGLKAKHRQFFDAPAPAGGIPLVHVMNYYDTYNKAFGVKDADIDAVLTFYGSKTSRGPSMPSASSSRSTIPALASRPPRIRGGRRRSCSVCPFRKRASRH